MKRLTLHSRRPAMTLVELLLFVALISVAAGAVLGFFYFSSDGRARQQTIADVDQNAVQLLQLLSYEIRGAERVIGPPLGTTGSTLVLQVAASDGNPLVIGVQSGALFLYRKSTEYIVSPPEVTVDDFEVVNASPSATRGSVRFSFSVRKQIPLPEAGEYKRTLDSAATLLQDDATVGSACGCALPQCVDNRYVWEICESGACSVTSGALLCP